MKIFILLLSLIISSCSGGIMTSKVDTTHINPNTFDYSKHNFINWSLIYPGSIFYAIQEIDTLTLEIVEEKNGIILYLLALNSIWLNTMYTKKLTPEFFNSYIHIPN